MAREPRQKAETADTDGRIAPDPFAAVLPALAALATIASIAAVNWVGQDKVGERSRTRRKAGIALRDLESCCLGLQEIFRRLHRNPKLFAGEGGAASSPHEVRRRTARASMPALTRVFQQLINDIASMLVLASQNAFDVMCAIEDEEILAPEQLFYELRRAAGSAQHSDAEPGDAEGDDRDVPRCGRPADALVRELKKHKVD